MKKRIKVVIGSMLIVILLLGLGYLGLSVYYQNGFSIQTYINGIYCTGKSVEVVNQELNDAFVYDGLTVVTKDGSFFVDAEDIAYEYDYKEPLHQYLQQQNPYLWIENLVGDKKEYKLLPAVVYDEKVVDAILEKELSAMKLPREHQVTVKAGKDGFVLKDTKQDILDEVRFAEAVKQALAEGESVIDLAEAGCYYDKPYSHAEEELMLFFKQLDEYQCRNVVYYFGTEKETFSKEELASTLRCYSYFTESQNSLPDTYTEEFFTQESELWVNEDMVKHLLEEKFSPYNTYRNHTFTTHDGRTLNIKGGTYGNQINMKKEQEEFLVFLNSRNTNYYREPEYTIEAKYKGKNDIGGTYIEVDIGKQKMFYFVNGEKYLETDVVTGKNKATREEVCYVYNKQKNRILRGPGYASPVDYWMPVSGGIGIHDASWRDEYGGNIYLTNGSHGCINTPLDVVAHMYEIVEIGTPCIIYYGLEET